ncbi:hypothetical protein Tco_1249735 [Tanacetum coccineum]
MKFVCEEFGEEKFPVVTTVEAEAVQIILTGIDNDIYSTVDACPNTMKMWKLIKRLKQGESIYVQDLETNLYWKFGKFTSRDGKLHDLHYSRMAKELEAHYMYMEKIQEVILDANDNFEPIFDTKPLQKVHNSDDDYNVFANERQHLKQPESVNNTYLMEQGDTNITPDSSDMS